MKVLDVGCGQAKTPGAVGIDIEPHPGVDVVHDLDRFPYPFADSEFDRIVVSHSLEHLADVVRVMQELHRIAAPGAVVEVDVPHFSSCDAYTDVTHRHFFGYRSFDYFTQTGLHGVHRYRKGIYQIAARHISFWPLRGNSWVVPHRLLGIEWLANRHPMFYEKFLAFTFPASVLSVRLVVVKP
jgi:SAM-dependent methyltransferase